MVSEIEMDEGEYEAYLNDSYGEVSICGTTMLQGTVLKECDPIAFRVALSDEPIRYKCDICNSEYDEEDEAQDCETECSEDDEVE